MKPSSKTTRSVLFWIGATLPLLHVFSCGNDSKGASSDSDDTSTEQNNDILLDSFFGLDTVHQLQIDVDNAGVSLLIASPKEYVRGSVQIGDLKFDDVGVRLKGGIGSFIPLDQDGGLWGHGNGNPGKSAFIIDFNRYVRGQNYLGLKKLTLNNIIQDPSGLNQFLGYALFRAGGVPASRSGFGQVTFNGEEKGLYALIETPDNDEFLINWYGTDEGNLYEGEAGSDLTGESADAFDQDNGTDTSKQDLRDLAAKLDAIDPASDGWAVLSENLEMDAYLNYAATELYLAHWDGYAWSKNNFMIHHDTVNGGWTFLPWGIDQLFDEGSLGNFAGVMKSAGPSWDPPHFGFNSIFHGGRVHELCIASPTCKLKLAQAFEEVIARVEEMDLAGLAQRARAVVEPLLLDESTLHGDPSITSESLDRIFDFIGGRGDNLSGWLPCLRDGSVDHDSDGYDGCTVDCDDYTETTHPDAPEPCNYIDDDCNAVIDDPPKCQKCLDVSESLDATYSMCFEPLTWDEARQYCVARGQDLASFHDGETNFIVGWLFLELIGIAESWIGLTDVAKEGVYTWTDDSPLDFENWIIEYPPEWAKHLDCVVQHAILGWLPDYCDESNAFICKNI